MLTFLFAFGFCFFGIGDCGNESDFIVDQYVFQNMPIVVDMDNGGNVLNSTLYDFIWINNGTQFDPDKTLVCHQYCIEKNRDKSWNLFGTCIRYCGLVQPIYDNGVKDGIIVISPANEAVDFIIYGNNTGYFMDAQEFVDKNEHVIKGQYYSDLQNYVFTANMTKLKQLYNENGVKDVPNNPLFIPVYHSPD